VVGRISFESVDPADNRAALLIREIDRITLDIYPGMPTYGIETEGFIDAGGTFLLLLVDGIVAGCGGLRPLEGGHCEVKRMYVRERFRGLGLARKLLQKLESTAAGNGVEIMCIETGDRQSQALSLYRSAGYSDIPLYGPYVDNPLSICLAKPLLSRNDVSFLCDFEDCTLPESEWTHMAHVKVAWLILTQSNSERALQRLKSGILRYNTDVLHRRHKYHETVTVAFARLVSSCIHPTETWAQFQTRIDNLLSPTDPILLRYYSDERLFSDEARERFIDPDREPLPEFRDAAK
jgi:GNAT superfamily N-acetyltransferase